MLCGGTNMKKIMTHRNLKAKYDKDNKGWTVFNRRGDEIAFLDDEKSVNKFFKDYKEVKIGWIGKKKPVTVHDRLGTK